MKAARRVIERRTRAVYHCMSRTVNGEVMWDEAAKQVLVGQLKRAAAFCGVEILTYCVMSNHFHVLVEVPEKEKADALLTDDELLRRYRVLYPQPTRHQAASIKVLEGKLAAGGEERDAIRQRFIHRMHQLPEFMRLVKQRFSVWFNRHHNRFGTLWAERFTSVLVEGEGNPLLAMALYIDLNPVRAGIVTEPRNYRFSGYADAVANGGRQDGIRKIVASFMRSERADALALYGLRLKGKNSKKRRAGRRGQPAPDTLQSTLCQRSRQLTGGSVFGCQSFVSKYIDGQKGAPVALNQPGMEDLHILHRVNRSGVTLACDLRQPMRGI